MDIAQISFCKGKPVFQQDMTLDTPRLSIFFTPYHSPLKFGYPSLDSGLTCATAEPIVELYLPTHASVTFSPPFQPPDQVLLASHVRVRDAPTGTPGILSLAESAHDITTSLPYVVSILLSTASPGKDGQLTAVKREQI